VKIAYLPRIRQADELMVLYQKALRNGLLFRIGFDKFSKHYGVKFNPEVILKTYQRNSGVYGFPDKEYVTRKLTQLKIMLNLL